MALNQDEPLSLQMCWCVSLSVIIRDSFEVFRLHRTWWSIFGLSLDHYIQ